MPPRPAPPSGQPSSFAFPNILRAGGSSGKAELRGDRLRRPRPIASLGGQRREPAGRGRCGRQTPGGRPEVAQGRQEGPGLQRLSQDVRQARQADRRRVRCHAQPPSRPAGDDRHAIGQGRVLRKAALPRHRRGPQAGRNGRASTRCATQMGNQGHCQEGYRRLCEYVWAGVDRQHHRDPQLDQPGQRRPRSASALRAGAGRAALGRVDRPGPLPRFPRRPAPARMARLVRFRQRLAGEPGLPRARRRLLGPEARTSHEHRGRRDVRRHRRSVARSARPSAGIFPPAATCRP